MTTQPPSEMQSGLQSQLDERLDALLGTLPTEAGAPGVAVGLWHQGREHYATRGVTHVEAPVAVDADTLFQTGSTGKTYTALAVMRLVEQGQLDLDVPVRTYVPELRMADEQVTARITMRHLLTHTSGAEGDLFDDFGGGADCLSRLAAGLHVLPQLAPLGTWTYSNVGFSVAGRALETVTGLSFEQAIQALVLDPLRQRHSVFGSDAAITHRVAVGHRPGPDGPQVTRPWALPRTAWPAGGLVSSVRDQIAYAKFHLGDGRAPDGSRLLTAEGLAYMRTPLAKAGGGRATAVGLAWLLQPTPGVIAHGGSANGQESAFVLVPERDFAITVLTNSSTGALLHGPLVKWALREVAQLPAHKPITVPGEVDRHGEYVGSFGSMLEVLDVHIDEDGVTGLAMNVVPTATALDVFPDVAATGPMPLDVFADDRVLVRGGAMRGVRGEFLRDSSGAVRWLRMLGRLHHR